MVNLKLEELRTKEELIKYFKQLGKNITEEEIEALKKQFEPYALDENTLTMQQLNEVAGGYLFVHISAEKLSEKLQKKLLGFTSENFTVFEHKGINEEKQTVKQLVIGYNDGENRLVRVEGDNFVSIEKNQIQITLSGGTIRNITTMTKEALEGGLLGLSGTKFESYNRDFLLHKEGAFFEEYKSADLEYARSVLESMQTHLKLNAIDFDKKISEIPGLRELRKELQPTETPVSVDHSTDSNSPKEKVESTPQAPGVQETERKSGPPYLHKSNQPSSTAAPSPPAPQSMPTGQPILPPGFTEVAQRPKDPLETSNPIDPASSVQQPRLTGQPTEHSQSTPPLPTVPAPELPQKPEKISGSPILSPSYIPTPPSSPAPVAPVDTQKNTQAAQQFGSDESQTLLQSEDEDDTSDSAQPVATRRISSVPSYLLKKEPNSSDGQKDKSLSPSSLRVEEQEQPLIQDKEQGNNGKRETQKQKELEKKCNKIVDLSIGAFSYIAFVVTALWIFAELDPNDFDKYITENISEISRIFKKIFVKDKK